jgi:hypothetical protein
LATKKSKKASKAKKTSTNPRASSSKASKSAKKSTTAKGPGAHDSGSGTKKASASSGPPKGAAERKSTSKSAPVRKAEKKATATGAGDPKLVHRAGVVLSQPRTPKSSIRRPAGAEELKQKIMELSKATAQIRALKRTLQSSFFEIGELLSEIDDKKLYEVKGYAAFEAFVERETGLGKHVGLKLARVPHVFQPPAARDAGLDRVLAALDALAGDEEPQTGTSTSTGGLRSPIPLHKQ